jgi:hypothetical protein
MQVQKPQADIFMLKLVPKTDLTEYLPDPEQVRADLERDELVPAQIIQVSQ